MLYTAILTLLPALVPVPQDGTAPAAVPASDAAAPAPRAVETTAEELRARIRTMRMNLLLGGDQVRRAEAEAVDFYSQKSRSVERRIDDVATELVEARATYDVTLDRALANRGSAAGQEALREAQPLRARITSLEDEADSLQQRRDRISELVQAVESRERERRKLVDQLESASIGPDDFGAPMMGIGLAPDVAAQEATAPLENDALFEDLLARDPRGARALLFEQDPEAYWRRFPLNPPARALRSALRFPRPDPVGRR